MGQGRDHLAEDLPIALNVAAAQLDQLVETARDNVSLFDFRHAQHRGVEGLRHGLK